MPPEFPRSGGFFLYASGRTASAPAGLRGLQGKPLEVSLPGVLGTLGTLGWRKLAVRINLAFKFVEQGFARIRGAGRPIGGPGPGFMGGDLADELTLG
ncbi:hypothetical protein [Mycolicibacterium monacense]|uniref:hypothetical protein n=1 Tax=Mycolicibacterium monacense TaxID=85693 RepID=UPI000A996FD1|nr:hypothetical protein [Mycolicibacterium monacense]